MKPFLKVMKALSDPSRVKIMKILQKRSMCVCEIQTALHVAQSTASKHLQILADADLIIPRKDGLWVYYAVADGQETPYAASLIGNLKHWLDNEPEIQQLFARLPMISRESISKR
jgi:ArsR family transcriptional regulator, arsenate/arsenite/antimonite-responsive transcriptional repressor